MACRETILSAKEFEVEASYAWKKLFLAVENMASSRNSLQQRFGNV